MSVCPSTIANASVAEAETLPAVEHRSSEFAPHYGGHWGEPRPQERLVGSVISFLIHLILILLLGFCFSVSWEGKKDFPDLIVEIRESSHELSEFGDALLATAAGGESIQSTTQGVPVRVKVQATSQVQWQDTPQMASTDHLDSAATSLLASDQILMPIGVATGGGVEGRRGGLKGHLLATRGGTRQSEEAVARGLRWLASHQEMNGRMQFDHTQGPCKGYCKNPGTENCSTAATALALLPFLGAGETHRHGEHQDVVHKGLLYLSKNMHLGSRGGDFRTPAGNLYGQGLATLAFCEAYAMTGDAELKKFAQAGIDFIVAAQNDRGGWRYDPGEPGDTTVTGWQLMALKSGSLAGLKVPPSAIYKVTYFLDSVSHQRGVLAGSLYGYQDQEPRAATTAIALYCRMLSSWNRLHPKLGKGVSYLADLGPSGNDMYFNYYATMVLHHYGGESWPIWNVAMRDQLIAEQAQVGHEAGSWYYPHQHSEVGGRLYNTCMALMTLEVYYRYMPLYQQSRSVAVLDQSAPLP
tara:strand:+ start:845 stop:2419 length:1575 start_codon:yes stop_codon:yes gene_type:complete